MASSPGYSLGTSTGAVTGSGTQAATVVVEGESEPLEGVAAMLLLVDQWKPLRMIPVVGTEGAHLQRRQREATPPPRGEEMNTHRSSPAFSKGLCCVIFSPFVN